MWSVSELSPTIPGFWVSLRSPRWQRTQRLFPWGSEGGERSAQKNGISWATLKLPADGRVKPTENTGRASTPASAGLGQDDAFAARCVETRPLCWSRNIRRGNICQRRRLASKRHALLKLGTRRSVLEILWFDSSSYSTSQSFTIQSQRSPLMRLRCSCLLLSGLTVDKDSFETSEAGLFSSNNANKAP